MQKPSWLAKSFAIPATSYSQNCLIGKKVRYSSDTETFSTTEEAHYSSDMEPCKRMNSWFCLNGKKSSTTPVMWKPTRSVKGWAIPVTQIKSQIFLTDEKVYYFNDTDKFTNLLDQQKGLLLQWYKNLLDQWRGLLLQWYENSLIQRKDKFMNLLNRQKGLGLWRQENPKFAKSRIKCIRHHHNKGES